METNKYRIDRAYNKIYKLSDDESCYEFLCNIQADQLNDSDDDIIEYLENYYN